MRGNQFYLFLIAGVSFGAGWFISMNHARPGGEIDRQHTDVVSAASTLPPLVESSGDGDSEPMPIPFDDMGNRHSHANFEERRDAFIEMAAAERAAAEEDDYRKLFDDLGVPDWKTIELLMDLKDMKRSIIVAEFAIGDCQKQKNTYLKNVEDAVGKEAYERYREYELGKPTRREMEKMNRFFEEAGMKNLFTSAERSLLAELIQQTGAFTDWDWDGPFSPAPSPVRGEKAVRVRFAQIARDLIIRSNELLMEIEKRGGSQRLWEAVSNYYEAQIQNKLGVVEQSPEKHPELIEKLKLMKRDDPFLAP